MHPGFFLCDPVGFTDLIFPVFGGTQDFFQPFQHRNIWIISFCPFQEVPLPKSISNKEGKTEIAVG